jgi:hypothetical protein
MRKNTNVEHIEGRVYQHTLTLKTVQNTASANYGKEYIQGAVEVAVDDAGMNIIPVNFVFVTETTKNGGKNKTYAELLKVINGKTWIADGPEAATMVSIDTSLGLNDFVASDGTMVSQMINQGGFLTVVSKLQDESLRNTFKTDIVINNITRVDADPEKNIPEDYVKVRGAVFNFRNDLLPVEFAVRNPSGMNYFEGVEISPSEPLYTCVWGRINFQTVSTAVTEESAFGEAAVTTCDRKVKEWTITGATRVPHDFGDETVMTAEELTKAMQDRQVLLANIKKQREEYQASKAAAAPTAFNTPAAGAAANAAVKAGGFSF